MSVHAFRRVKAVRQMLLVVAVCSLAACSGEDSGGGTGPSGSTPFEETINGNVAVFDITEHQFTTSRNGTMTATLTWANGAIDLDLYLTASSCNGYPPVNCTILARSDAPTGTSESVSRSVSSGNQFKFWVDNFSETLATNYQLRVRIE